MMGKSTDSRESPYKFNLREARRHVEEKDKSPTSKVMTVEEAVRRFVANGLHVALGGCLYSRTPTAVIHEIIRQKLLNLTISRSLTGMEADLLLGASSLKRVVTSWWSVGYAWGISKMMRKFVEGNQVAFDEWSHLSLGLRYRAAAMGISFLPTVSMLGSDLARVNEVKEMTCPYTDEKLLLIPALYPDVGVIHAQRADKFGNVWIDGYEFMDQDIARASTHVIVTTEEIVDTEIFRKHPDRTSIPFFCVDAVVKLPFGSYPSECWNLYEADFDHFSEFSRRVSESGIDGVREYLSEYVLGCQSFENFLHKIGSTRLERQRRSMQDVIS